VYVVCRHRHSVVDGPLVDPRSAPDESRRAALRDTARGGERNEYVCRTDCASVTRKKPTTSMSASSDPTIEYHGIHATLSCGCSDDPPWCLEGPDGCGESGGGFLGVGAGAVPSSQCLCKPCLNMSQLVVSPTTRAASRSPDAYAPCVVPATTPQRGQVRVGSGGFREVFNNSIVVYASVLDRCETRARGARRLPPLRRDCHCTHRAVYS